MIRRIKDDINSLNIKYKDNNFIFIPSILLLLIGLTVYYFLGFETAIIVILPLITFFFARLIVSSLQKYRKRFRRRTDASSGYS